MQNKKEKRRFSLFLLPLLYLTLFAWTMATDVTYSSYTTSSSGGDNATVAKFDIEIDIGTAVSEPNGEKVEIPIIITNNSEVTVSYDVVLDLPNKLPTNTQSSKRVVCSVNGEIGTVSTDGSTITIANAGSLAIGDTANTKLIIASEVAGASGISDLNSLTFKDATVSVQVTQVD